MTNAGQQSYTEEIPMLVVIFVAVTITVLVLVTMLIIANTMKRRIIAKTDFPSQEPGMQIKNYQVKIRSECTKTIGMWLDFSRPRLFPDLSELPTNLLSSLLSLRLKLRPNILVMYIVYLTQKCRT